MLNLKVSSSSVAYMSQPKKQCNHCVGSSAESGPGCLSMERCILRMAGVARAFAKRETFDGDQYAKCTRNVFK